MAESRRRKEAEADAAFARQMETQRQGIERQEAQISAQIADPERRMEDVFQMSGWRDYGGNEKG